MNRSEARVDCAMHMINKLTSVFHASVLLLIIIKFRHNIVKVAVDPRGDSRVDPPDYFDNVMKKINCQ